MSFDIRAFLPNRISGQIALIIVASLLAIHVVLTTAFFLTRPDHFPDRPPDQLVTLVGLIEASPAAARPGLVAEIATAFPHLELMLADAAPDDPPSTGARRADPQLDGLRHRLGPHFRVGSLSAKAPPDGVPHFIAIRLPDGAVVTALLSRMPPPRPFGPVTITLLTLAISVTLLGLWAARGLTGPLRHFARAAENFSPQGELAPLPERGPYEIRAAARALNHMRERIRSLIDERTRLLAAVSHDLRTPVTRLRLRCEFIEDGATRPRCWASSPT